MDYIELGYEYLLDVPELDNQHKELAKQLNNTIKHCTGKKDDEKRFYLENMEKAIAFLRTHFKTEEELLCNTKYENTGKHQIEHKRILDEITQMNDDIEKNKVELNLYYVTAFIREMVMNHIKTYDLSAKKYFIEGNEIKLGK
jgi:hemerythrin